MKRLQKGALGVIVVALALVFGAMTHNLDQYDQAKRCSSPDTASRTCIAYVPGKVVKEQKPEAVSYDSNSSHIEYEFVIETQNGKRITISIGESREDLRLGDSVELIRWDDKFFGISGHNRQSYLYGWRPWLVRTLLVLSFVLLAVIAIFLVWSWLRPETGAPVHKKSSSKLWIAGLVAYAVFLFTILGGWFMGLLT